MALTDLGYLLGTDEHALDLGGLVGAAKSALDSHIGAPAWAGALQCCSEVAEREPDPGMMRGEQGDDGLARLRPSATGSPVLGSTISRIRSLVERHAMRASVTAFQSAQATGVSL